MLTACGGSDEVPLTAADFRDEGNRICSEMTVDLLEIVDTGTGADGLLTAEARQAMTERRATGFEALFELQPPADLADDFAELERVREEFVEVGNDRIPEPDADLRLGPQWVQTALRLGLPGCA